MDLSGQYFHRIPVKCSWCDSLLQLVSFTMTHETRSFMGQLKQEMQKKKRKSCTWLHNWHFYVVLVWVVCQYGGLWCWKVALFLSQGVICWSAEQCNVGCHQNTCGQTTDMLKHFYFQFYVVTGLVGFGCNIFGFVSLNATQFTNMMHRGKHLSHLRTTPPPSVSLFKPDFNIVCDTFIKKREYKT